ncbi:MAG TPA: hypothetical protein VFH62_06835 [Dehalococcoidia bacterium]|nr:hypothetical protein [Dehalococcoidia bacterium]
MAQGQRRTVGRADMQRDYPNWEPEATSAAYGGPSGWAVYAAVMLGLAGVFGMINGAIAIIHDEVYVVGEERLVAFDFTEWGWIHLIGGGVVLLAALALTSGALWARILGVLVAGLHALAQVAFIEAYPYWALTIIALDIMVIYGCLVHGPEMSRA